MVCRQDIYRQTNGTVHKRQCELVAWPSEHISLFEGGSNPTAAVHFIIQNHQYPLCQLASSRRTELLLAVIKRTL